MKCDKNIFWAKVIDKTESSYNVYLMDIGQIKNVSAEDIYGIPNDVKYVSTFFFLFVLFYY